MLSNLNNIKFIGDLSLEDADVLAGHSQNSRSILEFGVGGSTQVIAQCGVKSMMCVDTDPRWIEITAARLTQIENATPVMFSAYTTSFTEQYDLILVDGIDHLRREFAIDTWKYLKPGGVMLFHDTRRFQDFQNAAWVAQLYFNEISSIDVNARASNGQSSNITVLHKKTLEPYVNWNHTENKPAWAYGSTMDANLPLWSQD